MSIRVYLIASPRIDIDEVMRFLGNQALGWTRSPEATETEELVEIAGRVCYLSFGNKQSRKTNAEYIRHLIRSGHESVLEHVSWTLLIEGVSRAFTHQLVRHRVGFAFSQLSQQYYDESEAKFVEPPQLKASPEAHSAWQNAIRAAQQAYRDILKTIAADPGWPVGSSERREFVRAIRSVARSVLPNATETKIVMTANARALRYFLKTRGTISGDLEMRLVSSRLLEILQKQSGVLFADFKVECLEDGFPIIRYDSEGSEHE